MTKPVYKIETYTGAVLDHTIEKDALEIRFKEILTSDVGGFRIVLPTKKNGSDYYYDDIAVFDKVKIWLDYDSVSGDPDFIGRIYRISAPLSVEGGYVRIIRGKSQGEILQRRFKKDKSWINIDASVIVTELANDLSIGTGSIESDTTDLNLTVKTETYFDLLKKISDYYDAGGSVKKDFYVDIDYDLVWAERDGTSPFRSGASVETFTVGDNIVNYQVLRDIENVRNDIVVYGDAGTFEPQDQDSWTESLTNWTASAGTLSLENAIKKYGNYSVECWSESLGTDTKFKRTFDVLTLRDINELRFWRLVDATPSTSKVRLLAPDTSNYFEADMTTTEGWQHKSYSLGPTEIYDANLNPNGAWTETGTPNWWNMQGIQFWVEYGPQDVYTYIDALYFAPVRWTGSVSDNTSKTNYGTREMEYTDDDLKSDTQCDVKAETLLYQMKDPVIRIDLVVVGNSNVLVGDRLSMTIPAENISASSYDVISVEQVLLPAPHGFRTYISMVDSANTRFAPVVTTNELLRRQWIDQKVIAQGKLVVK